MRKRQTNRSTVGALSELRAAADLIKKGYEVFRALDPSASCDLIALKEGRTLRVQVRTAETQINKDGSKYINCHKSPKDEGRTDLYAFVLDDQIIYEEIG